MMLDTLHQTTMEASAIGYNDYSVAYSETTSDLLFSVKLYETFIKDQETLKGALEVGFVEEFYSDRDLEILEQYNEMQEKRHKAEKAILKASRDLIKEIGEMRTGSVSPSQIKKTASRYLEEGRGSQELRDALSQKLDEYASIKKISKASVIKDFRVTKKAKAAFASQKEMILEGFAPMVERAKEEIAATAGEKEDTKVPSLLGGDKAQAKAKTQKKPA